LVIFHHPIRQNREGNNSRSCYITFWIAYIGLYYQHRKLRLLKSMLFENVLNKMLSYRRETALQGALVWAKSVRMGLGYDILRTL